MKNRMRDLISTHYLKYKWLYIEDMDYCVYFVTDDCAIKIGIAASLPTRIKQLQTGNPREIKALYVIKAKNQTHAMGIESKLHKAFSEKHVLGEWYDISETDIENKCRELGYEIGKPVSRFDFGVRGID